ncbi:hypothetical protein ACWD5F_34650 [Streptomyces sp. NPDC002499]
MTGAGGKPGGAKVVEEASAEGELPGGVLTRGAVGKPGGIGVGAAGAPAIRCTNGWSGTEVERAAGTVGGAWTGAPRRGVASAGGVVRGAPRGERRGVGVGAGEVAGMRWIGGVAESAEVGRAGATGDVEVAGPVAPVLTVEAAAVGEAAGVVMVAGFGRAAGTEVLGAEGVGATELGCGDAGFGAAGGACGAVDETGRADSGAPRPGRGRGVVRAVLRWTDGRGAVGEVGVVADSGPGGVEAGEAGVGEVAGAVVADGGPDGVAGPVWSAWDETDAADEGDAGDPGAGLAIRWIGRPGGGAGEAAAGGTPGVGGGAGAEVPAGPAGFCSTGVGLPPGASAVRCTGVGVVLGAAGFRRTGVAEPSAVGAGSGDVDRCTEGGEVLGGTAELVSAMREAEIGGVVGAGTGAVVRLTSVGETDPVAARRWTTGSAAVDSGTEGTAGGAGSTRGASTGVVPPSPGARCTTASVTGPTEGTVGAGPAERTARSLSAEGAADPPVSAGPPAAFAPEAVGPAEARGATGSVRRCTAVAPVRALVRDCGGRDGEAAGTFRTRRPDAGGDTTGAALGPAGTARVGAAAAEGPAAAIR